MDINVELSTKDIKRAINQLERYKKSLIEKNKVFVERLAEVGIPVIDKNIRVGVGDSDREHSTEIVITSVGNSVEGKLILSGKDILFWEFGAGTHFNSGNPNPKAGELGFGPGTYPGQTHVPIPGYWFYYDEDDNKHFSRGTEATMPMYKASREIIEKVNQIAREVFGSGN